MPVTQSHPAFTHPAVFDSTPVADPVGCTLCHAPAPPPRYALRCGGFDSDRSFCLCQCPRCGLIYNYPRLSAGQIAAAYDGNYYIFHRSIPRELSRAQAVYNRTLRLVPCGRPGRVLEIGCARGFLLALLQAHGWQTHGVELSAAAAGYARHRFGLAVDCATIESFATARPAPFDRVLAIDVLEHVTDPAGFIAATTACLAPGGALIIDTPNGGSANIATLGPRLGGFNPFHINLFHAGHLEQLACSAGLVIETCFSYNNTPAQSAQTARCRSGNPIIRSARGALRILLNAFFERTFNPAVALAVLRRRILAASAYPMTPDAIAPLAPGRAGGNLVLIARKPPI